MPPTLPTSLHEKALRKKGLSLIAGVDEAGAGALAGPVVAAAVVLPPGHSLEVRDSKSLSEKRREVLYAQIIKEALAWHAVAVSAEQIDLYGIRPCNYQAMADALAGINGLEHALVDAYTIPDLPVPQTAIVKGDQKEHSIAAASILAKVTRDRMMKKMHAAYPAYGFDGHKGYGTRAHREAIVAHGRCPIHRKTFTVRL